MKTYTITNTISNPIYLLVWMMGMCFSFTHAQTKQTRTVSSFDAINLKTSATVYLTQGSPQQVVVEGSAKVIEQLKTKVKDNTLRIEDNSDWSSHNKRSATVWITVLRVERVKVSGSGELIGKNTLTSERFVAYVSGSGEMRLKTKAPATEVFLTGSGDMDIAVDAKNLSAVVKGSGDIALTGIADRLDAKIMGSGDISATKCESQQAKIKISGSGDVKLYVKKALSVDISGSGDVYYKGGPQTIDRHIVGSGDVNPL